MGDARSNKQYIAQKFPSIIEIKKEIPTECFRANIWSSFYYVAKDLLLIFLCYWCLRFLESYASLVLLMPASIIYIFFQGTLFWCVFVLGHDCGHESFSRSHVVNDITGTVLHSMLLVPYYPWKLSHKHHHKHTGNIDRDEIFYPVREKYSESGCSPLKPGFLMGISWFAYLWYGFTPRKVHHLNPFDPMFVDHVFHVLTSLFGMLIVLGLLYYYWYSCGTLALLVHYVMPLLVFASWLVIVTFLHHNEIGVPWYADSVWSNVGGQLSTVDRDYGWAHQLTHNIGTHQVHHMFTKVPHYKLELATKYFRKAFPDLVRSSEERIFPAFLNMFKVYCQQHFIPDDTELFTYTVKNK